MHIVHNLSEKVITEINCEVRGGQKTIFSTAYLRPAILSPAILRPAARNQMGQRIQQEDFFTIVLLKLSMTSPCSVNRQ
jgi:hypothetical protein